jgi:hypothetical protein
MWMRRWRQVGYSHGVILRIGTLQWRCLSTIHHHKNIPTIRKALLKPVPKSQQYAWGNLSRIIMHLGWISDLQELGWVVNFSEWDKPDLFGNSNHKEVKDQLYDSTFMRGDTAHHAHIDEIMTFQISLMHHGDCSISWILRVNYSAGGHEKLSW